MVANRHSELDFELEHNLEFLPCDPQIFRLESTWSAMDRRASRRDMVSDVMLWYPADDVRLDEVWIILEQTGK